MRSPDKRFTVGLSLAIALAVAALAATATPSQAQFRPGGGFGIGPRAPTMVSPTFRSEPRFQRFNNNAPDSLDGGRKRGKGRATGVATTDGDYPNGRHPPRGKLPHIGPIIGTGVAIGTLGPAGAGTPPPSGGTPALRNTINIPPPNENRFVKDEVVLEFAANFPPAGIAQLLARQGLTLLETQTFTLTNSTVVRARVPRGRSVRAALQRLGGEAALVAGQPNFLYVSSQDQSAVRQDTPEAPKITPAMASAASIPAGGDPAQYALAKLHIGAAHTLANGDRILVAVIDSGVDLSHPELAGAVAGSYDALGKAEKPHSHGTAIAGAIAAHARLMGVAPAAKILAIRAFGQSGGSAEGTTMAILKSLEYASVQQARVINMSFAGPGDPGLSRALAAAKAKGAVLIAASGNFGPKSPPQFPAADPNVIAVSATDSNDKMFLASNIGPHIAVAAPGVDILLPAPNNDYQVTSGTSFSAAYVSGVVALMLQRAPGLSPDAVRKLLESTAKDLGAPGKDPEFGAGLVDAYQAILALQANASAAVTEEVSAQTVKQ